MRLKYFSKKVVIDGITFDSDAEGSVYEELKDRRLKGTIHGLRPHVSFVIIPKLMRVDKKFLKTKVKYVERVEERQAIYTTDFVYFDNEIGKYVMLEVKGGNMTAGLQDYVLRRKLIKQIVHKHNQMRPNGQWVFVERKVTKVKKKRGKKSS